MILVNNVDFRLNILFFKMGLKVISQVYAKELLKLLRGLDCRVNSDSFSCHTGGRPRGGGYGYDDPFS